MTRSRFFYEATEMEILTVSDTEKVTEHLQFWGSNPGDFEELVATIAEMEGFESIEAEAKNGLIAYTYRLNEVGRMIADEWAKENDLSQIPSEDCFYDEDFESVQNTMVELFGVVVA